MHVIPVWHELIVPLCINIMWPFISHGKTTGPMVQLADIPLLQVVTLGHHSVAHVR